MIRKSLSEVDLQGAMDEEPGDAGPGSALPSGAMTILVAMVSWFAAANQHRNVSRRDFDRAKFREFAKAVILDQCTVVEAAHAAGFTRGRAVAMVREFVEDAVAEVVSMRLLDNESLEAFTDLVIKHGQELGLGRKRRGLRLAGGHDGKIESEAKTEVGAGL